MANNCLHTRYMRTKCSDSRKGSSLQSWIWCILVKCIIGLPCVSSKCLNVEVGVATYPQGTINIRYGNPLEIFCVAEGYTSDNLVFTVNGDAIDSEKINETTRRLYIKKPEIQCTTYYCKNTADGNKCMNRVIVDTLPTAVSNFNCISYDLEVLNCSWSIPVTKSLVNYSLTYAVDGIRLTPPCIPVENGNNRHCIWKLGSIPLYRQQAAILDFFMSSWNIFGYYYQNFTIDHHSVVKPAKPTFLKYSIRTHSVLLSWSISNNMFDLLKCGVEHIIEYQIAKIDNSTSFRRVDTSSLPSNNKTYKFLLNNLQYAYMQYEVRIYVKTKKAVKREYWSDFSFQIFNTLGESPHRPPDMIVGGFDQARIKMGKRIVNVYWKQLEEYEEAGANFTYKVLYTQGNSTKSIFPNKNKSLSFVSIENLSTKPLHVQVWSYNANGTSPNSSYMYIPPETESLRYYDKLQFTTLAYENGTYELSWIGINDIDNYTLFWCHHNATRVCLGRMDFTVLDPKQNNHVIDLPKEYRYQFAISANVGTSTTGMVWAKCDISKDGFVMYRFPAELNYDAPMKTSVHLRWLMHCALKEGVITGYNISYCPIVETSTHCDTSVETKYKFVADPKQMDVVIDNLQSSRTYSFTLSLNTNGNKTIENATVLITTLEDKPTVPVHIGVYNVKFDSLVISWDPPLQKNGKIGTYVIYNYNKEYYVDKVSSDEPSRRHVTLTGLQPFTNYSLTVQACNTAIDQCSEQAPNNGIFVRTRIGPPGILKAPIIKSSPDLIKWEPPILQGGTVHLYQVQRVRDDSSKPEIRNTTELNATFTHCEGVVSTETYQVRAVNIDDDMYHGVFGKGNVTIPKRLQNETLTKLYFFGEWSELSTIDCRNKGGLTMTLILIGIFSSIGVVYGIIKLYKKYRKMEDIKPVLPNGLGIPEKEISKYPFTAWNPTSKDEKPSSDEMLLLPNNRTIVPPPDNKQKEDNCAASDHTDSTALSDSSRGPVDRQDSSSSDDGSNSSLHLEGEPVKIDNSNVIQEKDSPNADTESYNGDPQYFPKAFTKNPASGYVQQALNPTTGYVQSAPVPVNSSPPTTSPQLAGSSYVMAALSPPIFTTGLTQPPMTNPPAPSSGYVLPTDVQARSMTNFPKSEPIPTKVLGPESLPTMPTLPPPTKHGADNSYIQLQSLDALPSLKPQVRNIVPIKPPTSSGYVSPGDVVINKHLNNMLSGSQLSDESAILDPTMSPDAYCRFSWSTDPVNDNLHSLLADSTMRTSTKN